MLIFLRRIYRILAIALWFLVLFIVSIPCRFKGKKGEKRISELTHLWMKGVAGMIDLRVRISGEIPRNKAGLIVSNHLSYLDIIAHGSVFPIRFSPKADVARWPVLGWMTAMSRPVWVDRNSRQMAGKALKDYTDTVKQGISLIVYPEGTSSDGSKGIMPFKSTPFEAAVSGGLPVFPVLTRYFGAPEGMSVCWYGDMTLLPHLWQVLGLSSIEAELRFLPPVFPGGRSRKQMALFVHEIMNREYSYSA